MKNAVFAAVLAVSVLSMGNAYAGSPYNDSAGKMMDPAISKIEKLELKHHSSGCNVSLRAAAQYKKNCNFKYEAE